MNQITLLGNLTRDPEVRYITKEEKDLAIARFDLAINEVKNRDTNFFHCTAFGKQAEFIEKYFHKGKQMLLVGKMVNNNYTKQSGEKVYGYQVIVEKVYFAGNSADNANENGEKESDFENIPDSVMDNLPFN